MGQRTAASRCWSGSDYGITSSASIAPVHTTRFELNRYCYVRTEAFKFHDVSKPSIAGLGRISPLIAPLSLCCISRASSNFDCPAIARRFPYHRGSPDPSQLALPHIFQAYLYISPFNHLYIIQIQTNFKSKHSIGIQMTKNINQRTKT